MTAFFILLLFCLLLIGSGYFLRRVDWQAIEEENKQYYTPDGYHVYYDRKILRRRREKKQKECERKRENSEPTE